MTVHRLKCWPGPFGGVLEGSKRFEVRTDDRGFAVGDELVLEEWDQFTGKHTGRFCRVGVSWISRGPDWGLPKGMVVMSLTRVLEVG